ncbi:MAG: hypothetical protein EP330_10775 [Deltaproteobacteria bacterium]|nr:MAG: hypothetical protein EP330_10775 [Deltaproteobacteria bacterium]
MALLDDSGLTYTLMREHFDALDAAAAWAEVQRYGGKQLRRMYELAIEAEPITMDHFVPPGLEEGVIVNHRGRNSIPLPLDTFRMFSKPMVKLVQHPGVVCGFNDTATTGSIGPGFFICRESDAEHAERGAWVVDYLQVPSGDMPDGWPRLKRNEQGLQRFVYGGTQDYMRKVADRVSIGMPFKGAKSLGMPFVLIRED